MFFDLFVKNEFSLDEKSTAGPRHESHRTSQSQGESATQTIGLNTLASSFLLGLASFGC